MTNKYWIAFRQIKREMVEFLSKNYRILFEVWLFINGLLGIALVNTEKERMIWIINFVFQFVLLLIFCKFFKTVKEVQRPIKRFTKKNANGDIFVEEDRLHQALIYLCILEDQLEEQ